MTERENGQRLKGPHVGVWMEYDWAVEWVARRPLAGDGGPGTELPRNISDVCLREINNDPDAFAREVRLARYAFAMERHEK